MSVADAIITVWRAKYDYGFWRPITAINLADTDGNPADDRRSHLGAPIYDSGVPGVLRADITRSRRV